MARSERAEIGRVPAAPPAAGPAQPPRGEQAAADRPEPRGAEERVGRRARFAPFDALQVRDFRLFWFGLVVSNVGTWMQMIGQGWLVLQLTGSPFWLGLVAFCRAVPVLTFSLFAGVVADRVDRRRLLLTTQAIVGGLSLLLAVLTSLGIVTVWQIMTIASLSASVMSFDMPARQAMVPDLVGKDRLMNAVGLNSAAFNAAAVIGPSLAGVLIGAIGVAGCFYLNAVSFLATIAALVVIRAPGKGGAKRGAMWDKLTEGLRYIRGHRVVFALFALVAVPSLFGRPYQQLMPVFARDVLGGGPRLYGLLMAASGAGALLGALATASLGAFGRKGPILIGSTIAFGLALIGFALSGHIAPSLGLLVLAGGGSTLYMGAVNTLLQTTVPDEFRGRIMSVYSLILGGFMPLGGMLLGAAASLAGSVSLVVAAGGALSALCALVAAVAVPGLRRAD
jgi:MFS family permease